MIWQTQMGTIIRKLRRQEIFSMSYLIYQLGFKLSYIIINIIIIPDRVLCITLIHRITDLYCKLLTESQFPVAVSLFKPKAHRP